MITDLKSESESNDGVWGDSMCNKRLDNCIYPNFTCDNTSYKSENESNGVLGVVSISVEKY